jgi:hypothetical protein
MKIAEKLMNGIDISKDEVIILLWNTLIQLSAYEDSVYCQEEEAFDIQNMLSALDVELGVLPNGLF